MAGRVLVGAGDAMTFIERAAPRRRLVPGAAASRSSRSSPACSARAGSSSRRSRSSPSCTCAGWTTAVPSPLPRRPALAVAALRRSPACGTRRRGAASPAPPPDWRRSAHDLAAAWRDPGTRLGRGPTSSTQFSGTVFALLWGYPFLVQGEGLPARRRRARCCTVLVLVGMVAIGPVLGGPSARTAAPLPALDPRHHRSSAQRPDLDRRAGLARAGAPLLLLVVARAASWPSNGPGVDDRLRLRAHVQPVRAAYGTATGIVNVGGFVASLSTILLIGLVLSWEHPGGSGHYTLGDFRGAMCVQYGVWAIGLVGVLTTRRRLRALRAPDLDPFPRAVARVGARPARATADAGRLTGRPSPHRRC